MPQNKQEIFKLLLDLHKTLLENQKAEYEKKHGVVDDANEYFQLVVNHEDFSWLRQLSAKMVAFDEIMENDNQNITAAAQEIILLMSGESEGKFYKRLKTMMADNNIAERVNNIIKILKNSA